MPEVSVVIPTRNREALLLQALRSALAQKEVSIEVLVVDDGSDDGTRASVEAVAESRVKLLVNDRSQGVASARNRGVAQATGSWIAFLDDDDLWAPAKLRLQLASARYSGARWVYAGAVAVDEALQVISGGPPPVPREAVRQLLFRNLIPAGASNVVVRRDLLDTAGRFDPKLRHMADWDLWIRLGQLGAPAVVPDALVAYRMHERNASLDTQAMTEELRVIERRYADARAGAPVDRAYVHRWIAWSRLRAGDRRGALAAYWQACRAGDFASLARAAVAAVNPGLVRREAHRGRADSWRSAGEEWLRTIALSGALPSSGRAGPNDAALGGEHTSGPRRKEWRSR